MHKTSNIIREGTQAGRLWRDYVDESWPTHSTNKVKVKASMYKIEWTEKNAITILDTKSGII